MIWQHFPQWEAWLYIDEFIDSSKESNKDKVYRLNAERYSPLIKERQHFFYDMETNQLIKVTKYLFDILNSLAQMRIESIEDLKKHICKDSLFQDLTEKELIIYK